MAHQTFFSEDTLHFFKPLTGKHRERVVCCIRELYLRLNGPDADYRYHLNRSDVTDIFVMAIADAPALDSEDSAEEEDEKSGDALASATLRRLLQCGWLERYRDPGGVTGSAYRFTTEGRHFAATFARNATEIITSTQNTRSTANHLKAFIANLDKQIVDVNDLVAATRLSGEIIGDFNQIIEEIIEQRRELALSVGHELTEAKAAGEGFFDYLEKRFVPDVRIRLSRESVERFRSEINASAEHLRATDDDTKREIERQLRRDYPYLRKEERPSLLLWCLDTITARLDAACQVKMPELKSQLQTFVRRAHLLIDHLAHITFSDEHGQSAFTVSRSLGELGSGEAEATLKKAGEYWGRLHLEFVNPGQVQLRGPRQQIKIDPSLNEKSELSEQRLKEMEVRRRLEALFCVESGKISEDVIEQLAGGRRINAGNLMVTDVRSFFTALHAPMLGSTSQDDKFKFRVTKLPGKIESPYHIGDNYEIELLEDDHGNT